MRWYQGMTLLAALEAAEPGHDGAAQPFRMPVQFVNRPDHSFRGYAGTVATGTVKVGTTVLNPAARTEATVTRLVTMDGDLEQAGPGDPVTLVLDREIDVSRGDVLAGAPGPQLADRIDAWVVWMDDTPLFRGRAYQFMLGTTHRQRHGDGHHQPAGHHETAGSRGARAAHERDRPGVDFAVALGCLRNLRYQP